MDSIANDLATTRGFDQGEGSGFDQQCQPSPSRELKGKPVTTAGNVRIIIQNDTGVEIKTTKFQYRDGTRPKTENIFLGGSNTFDVGEDKDYTRNLEGIGDEQTEFTVTYQRRVGNNWSTNQVETTPTFTCHDNGEYSVVIS